MWKMQIRCGNHLVYKKTLVILILFYALITSFLSYITDVYTQYTDQIKLYKVVQVLVLHLFFFEIYFRLLMIPSSLKSCQCMPRISWWDSLEWTAEQWVWWEINPKWQQVIGRWIKLWSMQLFNSFENYIHKGWCIIFKKKNSSLVLILEI